MDLNVISMKTLASTGIDQQAEELGSIGRQIWEHPELGFEEYFAHSCLTDYLEKNGFKVERKYMMKTAFKATWFYQGPHPVSEKPHANIAILCEYDALPIYGHACGHNLIAEVGVATGIGLKYALQNSQYNESAMITVLGCPAEETTGGKINLIEGSAFNEISFAMMSHPSVANLASPKLPGVEIVKATYTGKASHACTAPWEGINALDAAILAYQGISSLKKKIPLDCRTNATINTPCQETAIIADFAEIKVEYRGVNKSAIAEMGTEVQKCLQAAADSTGCKFQITDVLPSPFEPMVHNKTLASCYKANCHELGIELSTEEKQLERLVFSTDMGNVSQIVPSLHPIYYIGTSAPNHSQEFAEASGAATAQPSTIMQAKALAWTAIDILLNPDLLNIIKQDTLAGVQVV